MTSPLPVVFIVGHIVSTPRNAFVWFFPTIFLSWPRHLLCFFPCEFNLLSKSILCIPPCQLQSMHWSHLFTTLCCVAAKIIGHVSSQIHPSCSSFKFHPQFCGHAVNIHLFCGLIFENSRLLCILRIVWYHFLLPLFLMCHSFCLRARSCSVPLVLDCISNSPRQNQQ